MTNWRVGCVVAVLLAACSSSELGGFSTVDGGLAGGGSTSGGASAKGGAGNGGAAAGANGKGGSGARGATGGASGDGGSTAGGAIGAGGAAGGTGGAGDGGTGEGGANGNGGTNGDGGASTGGSATGGRAAGGSGAGGRETGGAGTGSSGAGGSGTGGASGSTCGGFLGTQCPGDEWCDYEDSFGQCGDGDVSGVCRALPGACTREYSPVCGCDGQLYSNPCLAHAAGIDTSTDTSCFTGDAGSGDGCSKDSDCRRGLKCCYPCGIPGCQNQCMQVSGNQCPLIP